MHPSTATLVAYRDRELGEKPARKVKLHVEACPKCAVALERLMEDWDLLLAAAKDLHTQAALAPGGIERLRSAMECWAQPQPDGEMKRRADAHLQFYFGAGAAAAVKTPASLAAIRPMLDTFLGRKAASAVVRQILDGEDRRLCPVPGA